MENTEKKNNNPATGAALEEAVLKYLADNHPDDDQALDEWRRKQAHPTEPLAADAYADCVDSESADEIFERVQRLIDSCLSPAQQSIIRLHDYEQRGYDEIANRLNMEPAAVRMQLSRARKKIRECYNKR